MTRAILALLLGLAQFPVDAAPRRRAVGYPVASIPPAAIVTVARQAAEAALNAGAPAVQIAVSQGGRVIYSEAFGMSDRERATAATPRSVLQTGSITKQFTAAAILRLAERAHLIALNVAGTALSSISTITQWRLQSSSPTNLTPPAVAALRGERSVRDGER